MFRWRGGKELMKTKGFMMLESMVALTVAFLGMMIFSVVFLDSQRNEQRIEEKTDRALAERIMRDNNLKQVMIHDQVYRVENDEEN